MHLIEEGNRVLVTPLSTSESKEQIGTKAYNLSTLIHLGVKVPLGIGVTVDAFRSFLEENSLEEKIKSILKESRKNYFYEVEELFLEASIPSNLHEQLLDAYTILQKDIDGETVSVRSSSVSEDLKGASFAGQYITELGISNFDDLVRSVKKCWASIWQNQTLQYAENKNDSKVYGMGVIIQEMINADVSGVVFSSNPITSDTDEIVINASYGLGESIVSGLITPDLYVVSKKSRDIVLSEMGTKEIKVTLAEEGTLEEETSLDERERFCLKDTMVDSLVESTLLIENHYKFSVDIEFAIQKDRIYILQTRPITVL